MGSASRSFAEKLERKALAIFSTPPPGSELHRPHFVVKHLRSTLRHRADVVAAQRYAVPVRFRSCSASTPNGVHSYAVLLSPMLSSAAIMRPSRRSALS